MDSPPLDGDHIGRKHPASGVRIALGEPTIVFVTVVTRDRIPWLAQPLVHECLREAWSEAQAWLVGYYLIMPDHLHLFCSPRDLEITLDAWITFWKRLFKRRLNERRSEVQAPANPDVQSSRPRLIGDPAKYRWQEGKPWDTRLRRGENYQEKWEYQRENPVSAGLVRNPDDWPYQGMMNVLPW